MTYEHLLFTIDESVAKLTINRPALLNALSPQSLREMMHALDRVRDSGARVLVITGAGHTFCSGADLMRDEQAGSREEVRELEHAFAALLMRLADLPIPVVTAVNGAASREGCCYALAGDFVIAASSAYFLPRFADSDCAPDDDLKWLPPPFAGRPGVAAVMMMGDRIPAATAAEWGMIHRVVEDGDLQESARALAMRLASGPTRSYAVIRRSIAEAATQTFAEALEAEDAARSAAKLTSDYVEGVAAVREGRKPQFRGR